MARWSSNRNKLAVGAETRHCPFRRGPRFARAGGLSLLAATIRKSPARLPGFIRQFRLAAGSGRGECHRINADCTNATIIIVAKQQYATAHVDGFIRVVIFSPRFLGRQPRGVGLTAVQPGPNPVPMVNRVLTSPSLLWLHLVPRAAARLCTCHAHDDRPARAFQHPCSGGRWPLAVRAADRADRRHRAGQARHQSVGRRAAASNSVFRRPRDRRPSR